MTSFDPAPSQMTEAEFLAVFGGVYERSPWIASAVWPQLTSSHSSVQGLAALMKNVVDSATEEQQLALILAHPDLAGKAAQAGQLTDESNQEQASAGIDQCSASEFSQFQEFNREYKRKFSFPFIMAVKGSNRQKILAAFEQRLPNDYATEFREALKQIHQIALFRLQDIARVKRSPSSLKIKE